MNLFRLHIEGEEKKIGASFGCRQIFMWKRMREIASIKLKPFMQTIYHSILYLQKQEEEKMNRIALHVVKRPNEVVVDVVLEWCCVHRSICQ